MLGARRRDGGDRHHAVGRRPVAAAGQRGVQHGSSPLLLRELIDASVTQSGKLVASAAYNGGPMPHPSRVLLASVAVVTLSTLSGCGAFRRLAGNDTINLEKAEVKTMSVDIRRQQKTICPREPVQMAIFADVVLDGDKAPKPLETWKGSEGVNKNDKLDFADFAFHSEQGQFGHDGWFAPDPNLLATASKEFEIKSVFRRRPDKFSFTTSYKPDYACIKEGGGGGGPGHDGSAGSEGSSGKGGASGSTSSAGGEGGDAGNGTSGGSGGDGTSGPRFTVYATIVKTAFYERLVAIAIDGDKKDFLLVPEGQPITIHALGGAGGVGGPGGHGGTGGGGGAGNPGGRGGKGGQGGNGGSGGNGGPGGAIDYVYDASHPELRAAIKLDVAGGSAGPRGQGGGAGSGGSGGSGLTPSSQGSGPPPPSAKSGASGPEGSRGSDGAPGRPGAAGRSNAAPGAVKDKFAGRAEVTPL